MVTANRGDFQFVRAGSLGYKTLCVMQFKRIREAMRCWHDSDFLSELAWIWTEHTSAVF